MGAQVLVVFLAGAEERVLDLPTIAFWWIGLVRGIVECDGCSGRWWRILMKHVSPIFSSFVFND